MRWVLFCLLLFVGCSRTTTRHDIEKIVFNKSHSYSAFVFNKETKRLTELHVLYPVIMVDVLEGKPMYLEEVSGPYITRTLHIRSINDIQFIQSTEDIRR